MYAAMGEWSLGGKLDKVHVDKTMKTSHAVRLDLV